MVLNVRRFVRRQVYKLTLLKHEVGELLEGL